LAEELRSASAQAIEPVAKTGSNKSIVVIFKGLKKDPVAKTSMDGHEIGKLMAGMYLVVREIGGSHVVTVGENTTRSIQCMRSTNVAACGLASTPIDFVKAPFHPASLSFASGESETTYLLIERKMLRPTCCFLLNSDLGSFTDYKIREIKAKEGEKLVKMYQEMQ